MRFKLTQNKNWCDNEEKEKLERLGFKFKKEETEEYKHWGEWNCQSSSWDPETEIEIDTLEELMKFIREWGTIVLTKDKIEIYNDYRE